MNAFWEWFDNYAVPKLSIRADTFREIFKYLDKFKDPIIIETGCSSNPYEDQSAWSDNGCSTVLFDRYVLSNEGQVFSVNSDFKRVKRIESIISNRTKVYLTDSVDFLSKYDGKSPNLVYLDSYDLDWLKPSVPKVHHLREFKAILPKITPETLIVADDTVESAEETKGKGALIGKYAKETDSKLYFTFYQTAWLGFSGDFLDKESIELTEIVQLIGSEKYEEAEVLCDYLISCNECLRHAYGFKGIVLAQYNNHNEAIECFKKAIELGAAVNTSILKYYAALSLFAVGKQAEGWQSLFKARLENDNFAPLCTSIRRFSGEKSLFVGQPAPARVHIHHEGGYGDNFLLLRYLPMLADKGYTVSYESRPDTVKLVQDSFPQVTVMPQASDFPGTSGIPDFDYHLPIVDLPFIFQTDLDTIPWNGPYLKADPELVDEYKYFKDRIGLVWSANSLYRAGVEAKGGKYLSQKSIDFNQVKNIISDPERFVSLQAGPARLDNDNLIADCLPADERILEWHHTAALVENLNMVITIDTSVAHLAGAMGKPVLLMMHKYLTSFQFMAECPNASWNMKSPWYPTMKIFRQKERDDWGPVIEAVKEELRK